jgi:hypothetical protein
MLQQVIRNVVGFGWPQERASKASSQWDSSLMKNGLTGHWGLMSTMGAGFLPYERIGPSQRGSTLPDPAWKGL